jgi:hypothetical protein
MRTHRLPVETVALVAAVGLGAAGFTGALAACAGPVSASRGAAAELSSAAAAVEESAGVVITMKAWPDLVRPHLGPIALELWIENQSGRPLAVSADLLSLASAGDPTAPGLAPIPAPVPRRVLEAPAPPGLERRGGEIWPSPFSTEPGVSPSRNGQPTPNPPPRFRRDALEELRLEDGQETRGFVFFERPKEPTISMELRIELVDDDTGDRFGLVRVPVVGEAPTPTARGQLVPGE